ncbi:exported hypothetical protein [Candidatus Sulfotelmatobacter sp. SbA7]|nr:exported hypothetical protein [Candidatus Sulfotelmatobacter sp. SbA7]
MRVSGHRVFGIATTCCLLVFFAQAALATPDCSTTGSKASLPAGVTADYKSQLYGSPGSFVDVTIDGAGLQAYTPAICLYLPGAGSDHAGNNYVRFDSSSTSDKEIKGTLTLMPSAPKGVYRIYLADSSTLYYTGTNFDVRSSSNGQYADCPNAGGPVNGNQTLYCSQALLDYEQAKQIFGKGVADRYIVVQVTIRNLSDNYEYILQDVRVGTTEAVVASIDRKLVRGLAEKTEQFSARAIAIRLTLAGATMLTGIAGIVGNSALTSAANLTAGPASSGLQTAIPDLTKAELNRISDLAFSASQTVIPKHSSVPLVAFLSSKIFADHFKKFDQTCLMKFQENLIVEVAGAHVEEVNESKPAITALVPPALDLTDLSKSKTSTIYLVGTGLDGVTALHLTVPQSAGAAAAAKAIPPYKLRPVPPATTLDAAKNEIVVNSTDGLTDGKYSVALDTAAKTGISTAVVLDVFTEPTVSDVSDANNDLKSFSRSNFKNDVQIALVGTTVDSITEVHLSPPLGTAGKTLDYQVKNAKFTFPATDSDNLQLGEYSVTVDVPQKSGIQTNATITIK